MADPARLAINQTTNHLQWDLRAAIEGYARCGITGIGVWRDKLEECGVVEANKLLTDNGMTVVGLCRAGDFPTVDDASRIAVREDNRRAIDQAAEIGARCLVLVAGGLPPGSKDLAGARSQVRDGIGDLLTYARGAGVALAIEPLHPMYAADWACVNTMAHANDLCDELGEGLGIAVDVYHVWWDPNLEAEIARASGRIVAFHVSDWLVPTRDLLLDRGMMGDGVIDIPRIRGLVEAAGYEGFNEVEIFSSENWWLRDQDEVVRTCVERHLDVV